MIDLELKNNSKLWREVISSYDALQWYSNPKNDKRLLEWCRRATGKDDVYSFMDMLMEKSVFDYYNRNVAEICNIENQGKALKINLLPINPQEKNFQLLKEKADDIVYSMPGGLTDVEKICYIWNQVMKIDYDMRGFAGGHAITQDVVKDTRFFKNNKTICGTMSSLIKMICTSKEVNLPCRIIGTMSRTSDERTPHAMNLINVDNKWSIVDWTYGKLCPKFSKASVPQDFLLTSEAQYNSYEPACGRVENLDVPTVKIPTEKKAALVKLAFMPPQIKFKVKEILPIKC